MHVAAKGIYNIHTSERIHSNSTSRVRASCIYHEEEVGKTRVRGGIGSATSLMCERALVGPCNGVMAHTESATISRDRERANEIRFAQRKTAFDKSVARARKRDARRWNKMKSAIYSIYI